MGCNPICNSNLKFKILNLREQSTGQIVKQPFENENGILFDKLQAIFEYHTPEVESTDIEDPSKKISFIPQKIIVPPAFSTKSSANTKQNFFLILSTEGKLYQANLPENETNQKLISSSAENIVTDFSYVENFEPSLFDTSPNPDIAIEDDKPLDSLQNNLEIKALYPKIPELIDIGFTGNNELISLTKNHKVMNHNEPYGDILNISVVQSDVGKIWFSPFGYKVEYMNGKHNSIKNTEIMLNDSFIEICKNNDNKEDYEFRPTDFLFEEPDQSDCWHFQFNDKVFKIAENDEGNITVVNERLNKMYDCKNLISDFNSNLAPEEKKEKPKIYTILTDSLAADLLAVQWHYDKENSIEMLTMDEFNKKKDEQEMKIKKDQLKKEKTQNDDDNPQLNWKTNGFNFIYHSIDQNGTKTVKINKKDELVYTPGKFSNNKLIYTKKLEDQCLSIKNTLSCRFVIQDIQNVNGSLFILYREKQRFMNLLQLKYESKKSKAAFGLSKSYREINQTKNCQLIHCLDTIDKELMDDIDLSNYNKSLVIDELFKSLNRKCVKKLSSSMRVKGIEPTSPSKLKFKIFTKYFEKHKVEITDISIFKEIIKQEDFIVYYAILKHTKNIPVEYNKQMLLTLLTKWRECHSMRYRCLVFKDIFLQLKSSAAIKNTFFKVFEYYLIIQSDIRKELSCPRDVYQAKSLEDRKNLKNIIKWNDYLENLEICPEKLKFFTKFPYAASEICLRYRFLDIVNACDNDEIIKLILWVSTSPIFTEVIGSTLFRYFSVSTITDYEMLLKAKIYTKFTNALSICYSSFLTINSSKKGPLLHGYKTISSLSWSVLDGMVDGDYNNMQKICLKELITKCILLEKSLKDFKSSSLFISNIHPILRKLEFQAKDLAVAILENSVCTLWHQTHPEYWVGCGFLPKNPNPKKFQELKVDSVFSCTNIYNTNDSYFLDEDGNMGKYLFVENDNIEKAESSKVCQYKSQEMVDRMTKTVYKSHITKLKMGNHGDTGSMKLVVGFHSIMSSILDFSIGLGFNFKFETFDDVWKTLSNIFRLRYPNVQSSSKTKNITNNYFLDVMEDKSDISSKYSAIGYEKLIIMFDILLYAKLSKRLKSPENTIRMFSSSTEQNKNTFFKHSASVSENGSGFHNFPISRHGSHHTSLPKIPEALPLAQANELLSFAASKSEIFGKSSLNPELDKYRPCLSKFSKIPRFFIDLFNFSNYKYSVIYQMLDRHTKHVILQTRTSVRRGIRTGVTEYGLYLSKFIEIDRSKMVESVTKQVETLMKVSQAGRLNKTGTVFFVFEPNSRNGNSAPYLDVTFKNERGYGPGVDMSFYKSFGDSFLAYSDFDLPLLWMTDSGDGYLPVLFKSMTSSEFEKRKKFLFSLGFALGAAIYTRSETYNTDDTWQRCLGFRFSRPFSKLILGHEVRFHDLAFFDQDLFNSLRNLVHEVQVNGFDVSTLEDNFTIELGIHECGEEHKLVELCENGTEKILKNDNLLEYIELFTKYRMVNIYQQAAQIVRDGIASFINPNREELFFDDLSLLDAEDLSLIMCGERIFDKVNFKKSIYYSSENRKEIEVKPNKEVFEKMLDTLTNQEMFDLWFFWSGRANYIVRPGRPRYEVPTVIFRDLDREQLPTAATESLNSKII